MKRNIIYLLLITAPALLFRSCGEVEPVIYDGDLFVSFTTGTQGRYVVMEQSDPYLLQVGIPYPVDSDMEIGLKVAYATGTEGVQFDLPSSVRIMEGQVTAEFYVYGHAQNMVDRMDTLVIALEHPDTASFANEYTLVMLPPCDFVLEEFLGEFTAYSQSDYEDLPYAPYTVTFESNPNGGDTVIINGIWPDVPFKAVFNTDDPSNYTWNIPDQFLLDEMGEYGETRITDLGPGVVYTCEKHLGIRYRVYVTEGNFERATIWFEKK